MNTIRFHCGEVLKDWNQYTNTELKASGLTAFQYGSCEVVSKYKFGDQLIQLNFN